jgi:hypothetical protein
MIKYTDILKAINSKLKSKFPDVPIVSESDVKEKIVRPSFMTALDNMKASDFMGNSIDREMTARIYFFPTDRDINKIENLDKLDGLNELFIQDGSIEVSEDCIIELYGEHEIDIVDKVLQYEIEIVINDDYEVVDDVELMEDIEIDF